MPWRNKSSALSAFSSHDCDYCSSAKVCITTVVINYILLVLFLKNCFALIIQHLLSLNLLESLLFRMCLWKSQPFFFWRDLFLEALNWHLTFAQCLFTWSRMKATWNAPPLKVTLFSLTYSPSDVHAVTPLLTSVPMLFSRCFSLKTFSLSYYLSWCLF